MPEFDRIYLMSPYSHEDQEVREQRYRSAIKCAGELIKEGYIVFSPIIHYHPIAIEFNLRKDSHYWSRINDAFIKWADAGYILCIPGWDDSTGIAAEISAFKVLNKPITYGK